MLIKFNDLPNKEEFKCNECYKWLSVSPVFWSPGYGYVCGRCETDSPLSEDAQQQVAYETLANHMIFPCAYSDKGCSAELRWNDDVVQHEKNCKFTTIDCPLSIISGFCDWTGLYAELYQHVQQIHAEHVLNPPHLKLDFENEKEQIHFTNAFGKDFLIYTKFDQSTDKLYGFVQYVGVDDENELYRYQFELWDSDNLHSVILRRNKMEIGYDLEEKTIYFDMSLQIDRPTIKSLLNNTDTVFCKIGILKKSNKEIAGVKPPKQVDNPIKLLAALQNQNKQTEVNKKSNKEIAGVKPPTQVDNPIKPLAASQNKQTKVNQAIPKDLECPVCNEYMAPPIYVCETGHNICSMCRLSINTCPSCKQSLKNTRNDTLENLTQRMQYPCRNKIKNCTFIGNINTIFQHEGQCKNTETQCVANCKWNGSRQAMVDHLKSKHSDYVVDITDIFKRNVKDRATTTHHIICYDQEVFRFSCKHSTTHGPIRFNVQHFGMTKPTYKYVLEFFDQTGRGLELIVSRLCQMSTELPSEALKRTCLFIPLVMLTPFLFKKSILLFQIKLVKIKT